MSTRIESRFSMALLLVVVSCNSCSNSLPVAPRTSAVAALTPTFTVSTSSTITPTPVLPRVGAEPSAIIEPTSGPLPSPSQTDESFPPAGCSVQDITRLVDDFIDGLNRADAGQIGKSFSLDGFEEFYVGGTKGGKPYTEIRTTSKAELLAYVAARLARHEVRQQIETARVFPDANRTNSVAIAFQLSRKADDIALTQAGGKGAVYCGGPRIIRWIWDGNRLP